MNSINKSQAIAKLTLGIAVLFAGYLLYEFTVEKDIQRGKYTAEWNEEFKLEVFEELFVNCDVLVPFLPEEMNNDSGFSKLWEFDSSAGPFSRPSSLFVRVSGPDSSSIQEVCIWPVGATDEGIEQMMLAILKKCFPKIDTFPQMSLPINEWGLQSNHWLLTASGGRSFREGTFVHLNRR